MQSAQRLKKRLPKRKGRLILVPARMEERNNCVLVRMEDRVSVILGERLNDVVINVA